MTPSEMSYIDAAKYGSAGVAIVLILCFTYIMTRVVTIFFPKIVTSIEKAADKMQSNVVQAVKEVAKQHKEETEKNRELWQSIDKTVNENTTFLKQLNGDLREAVRNRKDGQKH